MTPFARSHSAFPYILHRAHESTTTCKYTVFERGLQDELASQETYDLPKCKRRAGVIRCNPTPRVSEVIRLTISTLSLSATAPLGAEKRFGIRENGLTKTESSLPLRTMADTKPG